MINFNQAREFYQKLLATKTTPPSTEMWGSCLKEIAQNIMTKNIETYNSWPPILRTLAASTLTQNWMIHHLDELKKSNIWKEVWAPIISPNCNTSTVNHSYYLYKLMQSFKIEIKEMDSIFEFGAGCGSMCNITHQLGFNNKYVIFDFPELLTIQKHYLSKFNIMADIDGTNVTLCHNLDNIPQFSGKSLFISTHALEEAPQQVSMAILEKAKNFDYFLIVFSGGYNMFEEFFKNNNMNYIIENFAKLNGHYMGFAKND